MSLNEPKKSVFLSREDMRPGQEVLASNLGPNGDGAEWGTIQAVDDTGVTIQFDDGQVQKCDWTTEICLQTVEGPLRTFRDTTKATMDRLKKDEIVPLRLEVSDDLMKAWAEGTGEVCCLTGDIKPNEHF